MKILNYGSINIDHVYTVPHIVRPGETISGENIKLFAGGKGANQSVAMANAGAEVYQSGKIGEDGLWLLEKMNSYGVQTQFIRTYDGPTGHTIIQVTPEAENSIILFGGGNKNITENEIEQTLSHFEKGDYLVLQNEINSMPYIIKIANQIGMKICLNPAPFDLTINELPLELIDLFIVNELEAEGLSGIKGDFDDILQSLIHKFPNTEIVMTVGEYGSYYGKDEVKIHVPITKTNAVDTTAAGDTFLGYFLASQIMGYDIFDSMIRASKAASITVSRSGAMDSIPLISELK